LLELRHVIRRRMSSLSDARSSSRASFMHLIPMCLSPSPPLRCILRRHCAPSPPLFHVSPAERLTLLVCCGHAAFWIAGFAAAVFTDEAPNCRILEPPCLASTAHSPPKPAASFCQRRESLQSRVCALLSQDREHVRAARAVLTRRSGLFAARRWRRGGATGSCPSTRAASSSSRPAATPRRTPTSPRGSSRTLAAPSSISPRSVAP
jgi:hypothetical protein